jgi:hypothetical protein
MQTVICCFVKFKHYNVGKFHPSGGSLWAVLQGAGRKRAACNKAEPSKSTREISGLGYYLTGG